ncbi:hypothetical protein Zmor_004061 [Zophobas morio]|uniref:TTF-type domain-containing protein n=1 Tax=Zophobas morio TaxID=2755281 RepID=A0AA38HL42_9CUCU|nr:hypothetical protein Zmor_004061 [Zophobas morio]
MDKYLIKINEVKTSASEIPCSSRSFSEENSLPKTQASEIPSTSKSFIIGKSSTSFDSSSDNVHDLAKLGEDIIQHKLPEYPKNKNRTFQAVWFKKFKWLEYSKPLDAAFCYACRQFRPLASKERAFTTNGFRHWKDALNKEKGFVKHASSEIHLIAMSGDILERHRYYVKSVADVIKFLVVNELVLRGTYDINEQEEKSLFQNLFEYTIRKDEKLVECVKTIPANATYLSPEIQNSIIQILADMVSEDIVKDIQNADIPWFSILEDGTRDKNNRENVSIGVRYDRHGKVKEAFLVIKTCNDLNAQAFTDLTLKVFDDYGLDTSKILSQCYDGRR